MLVQTDRQTDGLTGGQIEGQTDNDNTMFRCRGIKKNLTLFLLHAGKTIDSHFVPIPTGTVPESNHAR